MRKLIASTLITLGLTGGAAMAGPWNHGYRGGNERGQTAGERGAFGRGRAFQRGESVGRERGFERGRERQARFDGRGGENWRFRDHAWRFER